MNEADPVQRKVSKVVFAHKTRVVILFLSMFCLTIVQSNSVTVNFTVICMNDVIEEQKGNSTEPHWLEVPSDVSLLFSVTAVGSLLGVLPSVKLLDTFGIRNVITAYAMLSGIGTLLFPLAVNYGLYVSMVPRLFQGLGISMIFTNFGAISEKWSVMTELSTFLSFISTSIQLSPIITMPLAGFLCESSLGWRWLYYIFGVVTILSHIVFYFFFSDHPSMHKNVSEKELGKITQGKSGQSKKKIPYRAVCSDKTILGIWASLWGSNMGMMLLSYYGPTYLNKVMGMDVKQTGVATALPFALAALLKFIAGPISDRATCVSEAARLMIFTAISQLTVAASFIVLAFTNHVIIAQVAYTVAVCGSALIIVGSIKAGQVRARQYGHFVMAVMSLSACLCTFILPTVVGLMCPDNTHEQWSRFYIVLTAFVIIANVPFMFVATAEAAPYTKADWVNPSSIKHEDADAEKSTKF